jgi:hypothetical protein
VNLRARIAAALRWDEAEASGFSLLAMRDLVAPVSPKLAREITLWINAADVLHGEPLSVAMPNRGARRALRRAS